MLETVWYVLWGLLWAVYFLLDGFDLGAGSLFPFLARDEGDRRMVYNALGPFWDGNEVWLITAGGVTFAAFPGTYAVMFSAFYTPLLLILFLLILRGAALGLRAEVESRSGKMLLDQLFTLSSAMASFLFGVVFVNLFRGAPLNGEGALEGGALVLLNPYGLLGGVLFAAVFAFHGALWLITKSEGTVQRRALALAKKTWFVVIIMAGLFLLASAVDTPLLRRYLERPALFLLPLLAAGALVLCRLLMAHGRGLAAWAANCVFIAGVVALGLVGIYPALLPSSLDPGFSLTIHNSASTPYTLKIMLGVAGVFVPLVIAYQGWVYWLFRERLGDDEYGY
jgi:cytochrome d ubiquinol oxidase subunit II